MVRIILCFVFTHSTFFFFFFFFFWRCALLWEGQWISRVPCYLKVVLKVVLSMWSYEPLIYYYVYYHSCFGVKFLLLCILSLVLWCKVILVFLVSLKPNIWFWFWFILARKASTLQLKFSTGLLECKMCKEKLALQTPFLCWSHNVHVQRLFPSLQVILKRENVFVGIYITQK